MEHILGNTLEYRGLLSCEPRGYEDRVTGCDNRVGGGGLWQLCLSPPIVGWTELVEGLPGSHRRRAMLAVSRQLPHVLSIVSISAAVNVAPCGQPRACPWEHSLAAERIPTSP